MEPRRQLRSVLLGHAPPRQDELLSSWIIRLAIQNIVKVHTLCQMIWRDGAVWNRDIDNSAPGELLRALSHATGQQFTAVCDLTLASFEGRIFEKHNPAGYTQWLLPLGVYHRTRKRHGQQFCPDCLDEGIPYFRKSWRLAFSVVCERHRVPLSDRCCCDAPVNFHRADLGDRNALPRPNDLIRCFVCNQDLRSSRASVADIGVLSAALEVQQKCTQALTDGYAELGASPVPAILFFVGFHQLIRLLINGRNVEDLRATISAWRTSTERNCVDVASTRMERLDTAERVVLMALAGEWLRGWPEAFLESCQKAGLTASDIYRDMPRVPYWLACVVEESLKRSTYSPTLPEIRNAIAYLRKRELVVNKASVSRLLGSSDAFRKRGLSYLLGDKDTRD